MTNSTRPVTWGLTVLLGLLIISVTFSLSGCSTAPSEDPINLDSVRTHAISIKDATELTHNFQHVVDTFITKCPGIKDSLRFGYSEAFNRDTYKILLAQKDSTGTLAAGIRIYYGLGKTGQVQLVMVPYDQFGNDMLKHLVSNDDKQVPGVSPAKTESLSVDGPQAMEQGQHCPPTCPPTSPLDPTKP